MTDQEYHATIQQIQRNEKEIHSLTRATIKSLKSLKKTITQQSYLIEDFKQLTGKKYNDVLSRHIEQTPGEITKIASRYKLISKTDNIDKNTLQHMQIIQQPRTGKPSRKRITAKSSLMETGKYLGQIQQLNPTKEEKETMIIMIENLRNKLTT